MPKPQRKPRPKTGEEREVNRPLKIDLLPQSVRDAIGYLRDRGEPWPRIEMQSARPYSEKWKDDGGGFVDWAQVPIDVLEEFPDLRLPKSTLHRWYDLRIDQVRSQTLMESNRARSWAQEFASKSLPDANAAVINALRDQVFTLMRGVGLQDQGMFIAGLKDLSLAMTRMQRVELQGKRVEADLAKIDAERARLQAEAGDPREIYLMAAQSLLKSLRTRKQVREVLDPIQEELIQELSHAAEAFAKQVEASAS